MCAALTSYLPVLDHVVAVDGRYAALEADAPNSPPDNYGAIQGTLADTHIGYTIHRQSGAWEGNEVEKRTQMFRLAESISTEDDWYLVLDADTLLAELPDGPDDLRSRLGETDRLVGEVCVNEPGGSKEVFNIPVLFRALRGLHCEVNHYTFVAGDGRVLWGYQLDGPEVEKTLDLTKAVGLRHLTHLREDDRRKTQKSYYRQRDKTGQERDKCRKCKTRAAVRNMYYDFELTEYQGQKAMVGAMMDVCKKCYKKQKYINDKQMVDLGFDPESVKQYLIPKGPGIQRQSA